MITSFLICLFFYFLGSIPITYLVLLRVKKINILKTEYKHSGVSNLYKYSSKKILLFVLFGDVIIKGFIPTYIIKNFTGLDLFIISFLIIGHNWSFFIKLRGGKGLTVSLGILAAISSEVFISIIILFLIFWISRRKNDSSAPWIVSIVIVNFVVYFDHFYFGLFYKNLSNEYIYSIFLILLLLLFRRSLGNYTFTNLNRSILFSRIFFDREKR
ncbi:MAG: glycerol-3-phosphate acyltransferase [SAR202 cluster bacterium]|nr:glycerol-3-phosphate acyltransferase [SAR202 cluster bacterium]